MLFRTRKRPDFAQRFRLAVWPRVSWSRSARYFHRRVVRLTGSPHGIAVGVAIGVGIAFTPFVGFHIVLALIVAFLLGANLVAAALGSAIGNPLTFPFIFASTYKLGRVILGAPHVQGENDIGRSLAVKSWDAVWPILKPMIVGSIPLGLVAAAIAYVVVFQTTRAFRKLRSDRMAARRLARSANDDAGLVIPQKEATLPSLPSITAPPMTTPTRETA